jgi:hypothetical protein
LSRAILTPSGAEVGRVSVRQRQQRARAGWERLSRPGDKCSGHWLHVSGWEVRHCGHPTANWPYYATSPGGQVLADTTGRGFRLLADAFAAVEARLEEVSHG